jgi:hypothetical protein
MIIILNLKFNSDVSNPYDASVELLEDMVLDFIYEMVRNTNTYLWKIYFLFSTSDNARHSNWQKRQITNRRSGVSH